MFSAIGKYVVCLLVGAAIGAGLHWHYSGIDALKQELEAERTKSKLKDGQHDITDKTVVQYVDRVKTVYKEGEKVIQYVPIYIKDSDNILLPSGFRLLHDAAVSGGLPDAARTVDAEAVELRTAAETITRNYTGCRETAEQLIGLQTWVAEQHKLGNSGK